MIRVARNAAVVMSFALIASSCDLVSCIACPGEPAIGPNFLYVEGKITVAGVPAAAVVEVIFASPSPECASSESDDCVVAATTIATTGGTVGLEGWYRTVLEDPKDHAGVSLVDPCRFFALRATLHDPEAPHPWVRDDSAPQMTASLTEATGPCRMPEYPDNGPVVHTVDIDFPGPPA